MYIAPRPPPRPRPRPRGLRPGPRPRPRPPRLPRPPLPLGVSGDFTESSSIFGSVLSTTFSSGASANNFRSVAEEFRLLLVRGVVTDAGILSRASVIRGSLILELVGSISSGVFCSSTKNLLAVSTSGSLCCGELGTACRFPRPRPLPLGFTKIAGRSLKLYKKRGLIICNAGRIWVKFR